MTVPVLTVTELVGAVFPLLDDKMSPLLVRLICCISVRPAQVLRNYNGLVQGCSGFSRKVWWEQTPLRETMRNTYWHFSTLWASLAYVLGAMEVFDKTYASTANRSAWWKVMINYVL